MNEQESGDDLKVENTSPKIPLQQVELDDTLHSSPRGLTTAESHEQYPEMENFYDTVKLGLQRLESEYEQQCYEFARLKHGLLASGLYLDKDTLDTQESPLKEDIEMIGGQEEALRDTIVSQFGEYDRELNLKLRVSEKKNEELSSILKSERIWFCEQIRDKDCRIADLEDEIHNLFEKLQEANESRDLIQSEHDEEIEEERERYKCLSEQSEETKKQMEKKLTYLKRALGEE